MTDYTTNRNLPFPEGQDPVAVPSDVEGLAKRTDIEIEKVDAKYQGLPAEVHQHAETLTTHDRKLAPVEEDPDDRFEIVDLAGRRAFQVMDNGDTGIGDTTFSASPEPLVITDQTGAVALEIDEHGRTRIYDSDAASAAREWHVFLAVGQSNMAGSGLPYSPELDPQDPRILQYGAKDRSLRPATVPLDMHDTNPRGMSPATAFAREYLRHAPPHVGVVLVPAARSGTYFTTNPDTYTWTPKAASAPEWDLYAQSVAQTQQALTALGEDGQLKGILWHQGEGNVMTTEDYAAELDNLIAHYRTDFGLPQLPFVVGQMSQERIASHATRWRVDRAHMATPARVERTGFAPSKWGWASYDETHFGRAGAIQMGHNMVSAYWQALANTHGAQLLPPVKVTTHRAGDQVTVSWDAPPTRVTGYLIRTKPMSGSEWSTIAREWPMSLTESITAPDPIDIEVTSTNGTETSTIVLTQA